MSGVTEQPGNLSPPQASSHKEPTLKTAPLGVQLWSQEWNPNLTGPVLLSRERAPGTRVPEERKQQKAAVCKPQREACWQQDLSFSIQNKETNPVAFCFGSQSGPLA